MDRIAQLEEKERSELFRETAARLQLTPIIAEKDFWVVWVLKQIFNQPHLAKILKFKGGTSLSKAYNIIERFSEDIDLILDWRSVTNDRPIADRSRSSQDRLNKSIQQKAKDYISKSLLPIISDCLSPVCKCSIKPDDGFAVIVRYPAAFADGYIRNEILLEIGPLAAWLPSESRSITSFAATAFPDLFSRASFQIPTIAAERTFWEKATILHQEAHRPLDKPMPLRYSRHYYDLAMLAGSSVCERALADSTLLKSVADFKARFYNNSFARYDLATPSSLLLIPGSERLKEIENDYRAMQQMIYGHRPTFSQIITTLDDLLQRIRGIL